MKKLFVYGLAVAACAVGVFQSTGQAQTKNTGEIHVMNRCKGGSKEKDKAYRIDVLVTLYQSGQAVRSTTIQNHPGQCRDDTCDQVRWGSLPSGAYEVHFQATGSGKVIKPVVIAEDTTTDVTLDSISRKDEVWESGPTVFELQKRIQVLEGEVADLKKK